MTHLRGGDAWQLNHLDALLTQPCLHHATLWPGVRPHRLRCSTTKVETHLKVRCISFLGLTMCKRGGTLLPVPSEH